MLQMFYKNINVFKSYRHIEYTCNSLTERIKTYTSLWVFFNQTRPHGGSNYKLQIKLGLNENFKKMSHTSM